MEKKIKKEELEALVNANRVYIDLKFNLADIEMSVRRLGEQKELTMQQLEIAAATLTQEQQSIFEKYGDVSVNLQTGEYN
jgi:glycyl-tRNA synthetase (class II)